MSFNPENFGFKKMKSSFHGVMGFEYNPVGEVTDSSDFLRLNIYLSQDSDFINIWFGLLEPIIAESMLGLDGDERFDFDTMYQKPLFCGYIENDDAGEIILKAFRLEKYVPQYLSMNEKSGLTCDYVGQEE